jgi:hypothetical protein
MSTVLANKSLVMWKEERRAHQNYASQRGGLSTALILFFAIVEEKIW